MTPDILRQGGATKELASAWLGVQAFQTDVVFSQILSQASILFLLELSLVAPMKSEKASKFCKSFALTCCRTRFTHATHLLGLGWGALLCRVALDLEIWAHLDPIQSPPIPLSLSEFGVAALLREFRLRQA